jgi:hypothetical protein
VHRNWVSNSGRTRYTNFGRLWHSAYPVAGHRINTFSSRALVRRRNTNNFANADNDSNIADNVSNVVPVLLEVGVGPSALEHKSSMSASRHQGARHLWIWGKCTFHLSDLKVRLSLTIQTTIVMIFVMLGDNLETKRSFLKINKITKVVFLAIQLTQLLRCRISFYNLLILSHILLIPLLVEKTPLEWPSYLLEIGLSVVQMSVNVYLLLVSIQNSIASCAWPALGSSSSETETISPAASVGPLFHVPCLFSSAGYLPLRGYLALRSSPVGS